jgi:nucleoside-diphosphate-sugar epimerase
MRVLVTGGNGFIGGHLIDRLLAEGHQPISFDRFGAPHRSDVDFIIGDVRDAAALTAVVAQVDGVINLAGILGTSETIERPRFTVQSNLLGAINVFNACRALGKKGVQITVGNYWMNNPYAITKNASERVALAYNREFGTRIAVVRGLNAYGERQKSRPVRKIMPNLVVPALRETEALIYGDGEQLMDMIYVGDLAEVLMRALVLDHGCYDRIFEAGWGREFTPSINQLADKVMAASESRCRIRHVPMRGGEPPRSMIIGDPETLRPLGLSVEGMVPLDEGIRRTLSWYRKHLDEFE